MTTCNDCIHSGVCAMRREPRCFLTDPPISENIEHECLDFHAKDRFVELPCKLGDEIFYTTMGKIHQAFVDRIELYDEGVAIITTDGYCPDSSICYHTREEAEKALKERENSV